MLRMCIQQGQTWTLPRHVQSGADVQDGTEECDGDVWRYDWHGLVVLADEKHHMVQSRGCGESNDSGVDALRCRARRRTQSRCAKTERKQWQLQRAGERRSKALLVRGIEFDDDSDC